MWSITVNIRFISIIDKFTNLIVFTAFPNHFSCKKYGSCIPTSKSGSILGVNSAVNGQERHNFNIDPIILNHTYHVEIHQRYIANGNYRYFIVIDGKEHYSIVNKQAQQFHNVHVFASNKHKELPEVYISNLKFTNFL